jgi:hypothetical protein
MKRVSGIFYSLITFSFIASFGSYYWIARYLFEAGNPQRDELITGFMMVATLSSPLYVGVALMALFGYRKLERNEITLAIAPTLLILIGFGILVLLRF